MLCILVNQVVDILQDMPARMNGTDLTKHWQKQLVGAGFLPAYAGRKPAPRVRGGMQIYSIPGQVWGA